MQNEFVSVTDIARGIFSVHPWSIGGGGAAELKQQLEQISQCSLSDIVESLGIMVVTLEDNAFVASPESLQRFRVDEKQQIRFVEGDAIRDWVLRDGTTAIFPYKKASLVSGMNDAVHRRLWPFKAGLAKRIMFGKTQLERDLAWSEYGMFIRERYRSFPSLAYAEVATHNHFVLDRGGKVFNRTAPVIKLPSEATENDHLALLGLLNSSTACFWMKQVFHNKGSTVDGRGARQTTAAFENFYQLNGTGLQKFPVPSERPLDLAVTLDGLANEWGETLPSRLAVSFPLSQDLLNKHRGKSETLHGRMIALQEELDWKCYRLYELLDTDLTYDKEPPPIQLGQRAFEIVMARKMAAGELETTWFERHGSTPITEIPTEWPNDYKQLVERRIELIQTDRNIGLIEQPEYKRRWNTEPWESQLERALRNWLLDRLESYFDFDGRMNDAGKPTARVDMALISTARLADVARQDADFMQVAELYRDDPAFEVLKLVSDLVEAESVPLLPVLRYKAGGLRKRAEWERTWELQREEDRLTSKREDTEEDRPLSDLEALPKIPVPPKYTSGDFATTTYWRLRGKLDVPKERWVSFPHCEGADGTLMIAWAGYDHLQLALAISAHYVDVQERLGGRDDPRLVLLLGCLIELLPWLKQWHNDVNPEFGMPMGDYFDNFVQDEARQMGKTLDEIKAWQASKKTTRPKRRKRP